MGGDAASRQSRGSKISSMKYLRDAQSIQSRLKKQRKLIKPYQPDDALKLIEMGRMRRTLVKCQNGVYKPVKNVDEDALDNVQIRVHTEED